MGRLKLWFHAKKVENEEMAKRKKPKGKSVKNGNAPSPYLKYQKQPYNYGEGYKQNYLKDGVLFRNGKPHRHADIKIPNAAGNVLQAAE